MDETRLREIERQYPEGLSRVGDELIAALRDAWKERDAALERIDVILPSAQQYNVQRVRAARAEAERDTLQAMWNTLADAAKEVLGANHPIPLETLVKLEHAVYSEHPDTIVPARKELERLRAVREAAEIYVKLFFDAAEKQPWKVVIPTSPEFDALRRALAAAKDPAR